MRQLISEKTNGQLDEIVPVSSDQAAAGCSSVFELLIIFERKLFFFDRANGVDSVFSQYGCDFGTEIGVQVILHLRSRP